ncbi:hypothetical protein SASPL_123791 [Salvia splendens]|uniref:Dihydroflavonol 4-reductase n=1 Tax=Salvia splendens TaxID=180675 RepID=A0A8X8XMC0_SALSN|nr:hypothetical protein SASPL_123791 [Salvia splendens]
MARGGEDGGRPDFDLPAEILSVIPTDPYDQLDLARKITSMAIASRVTKLETEAGSFRQKLQEKDRLIQQLEDKVAQLDGAYQDAEFRLKITREDNLGLFSLRVLQMKLLKERDSLAVTAKKLSRDLAKRELDADLDKIRRSLQDMCSTMETTDVSSGSCKLQLELPKSSDNLDFQKSIDVDRVIADEDLIEQHNSGRFEEMDTKLEIGVEDGARSNEQRASTNVGKDRNYVIVLRELGWLYDGDMEEQVVAYVTMASELGWLASNWFTRPKAKMEMERVGIGDLMDISVLMEIHECGQKMGHKVDNLFLSTSAQSAGSLVMHRIYFLSMKWLLDCDPKPKVKMKCRVDCVEFYSNFSHHCNRVDCVEFMVVPIDSCRVFKGGGMTRATHMQVTGASGYVAIWLVKFLLRKGYTVKASARNSNNAKKTQHLLALDGAKERLHLVKVDLLEEGSFDSVVDGCEGVFHTASPFFNNVTDPQAELIDPAVKGTLNVLGSCAKVPSVKRIVLTSSIAAVAYKGKPLIPETVVDEMWWSSPEYCEQMQLWYVLSKTLAEDAAWKFVKEKGIEMVAINPGMVIGPLLQPTLNESSANICKLYANCNLESLMRLLVVLSHRLSHGVVAHWFSKPRVKMKLEKIKPREAFLLGDWELVVFLGDLELVMLLGFSCSWPCSTQEAFRRQLMQSLNEENSTSETVEVGTYDQSMPKAYSTNDDSNGYMIHNSYSSSTDNASTTDEVSAQAGQKFFLTPYITPRLTPTGTPKVISSSVSPRRYSAATSPQKTSGTTSPSANYDRKGYYSSWYPSSQQSSAANSPPRGSPLPGRTPRIDGKEFFRQARSQLSLEQFSAFLANIKELNAQRQSWEETLRKAEEIFGTDNKDLFVSFQGLLNRNAH